MKPNDLNYDDQTGAGRSDPVPGFGDGPRLRRLVRRAYQAAQRAGPALSAGDRLRLLSLEEAERPLDADEACPEPAAPAWPSVPGYVLLDRVAAGGQGAVFRAVQECTGRRAAVKVLAGGPLASSQRRARFDREVRVLAALDHPNLVQVIDRGRAADGSFFFAMPFVDGCTLDEYLDPESGEAPADARDVAGLFARVAAAVGEAHARGVVHRDLKPSNVRVDRRGEPRVLDFGLARVADDPDGPASAVTLDGQVVGTPPWLSPEQAAGAAFTADARCDVYALGLMLYQALAGRTPYETGGSVREILDRINAARIVPPGRVRGARCANVPRALDAVVMKALSRAPTGRHADAAALAKDLEDVLAGRWVRLSRRLTGPRARRAARAVAAGVCGFGGLVGYNGAARLPDVPRQAAVTRRRATVTDRLGIELVAVPAGKFQMGGRPDEPDRWRDQPLHAVELTTTFLIGVRPVTRGQFYRVMRPPTPPPPPDAADQPVDRVTWEQACTFCRKVGELEGGTYRLPSEAEWEYACRAGAEDLYGGTGGDPDRANPWGLYGMCGGVMQWCQDFHNPYETLPAINPVGAAVKFFRVARGGRTSDKMAPNTAAVRIPRDPRVPVRGLGFRIVREK